MKRPQITPEDIARVIVDVKEEWLRRLDEKGHGIFASSHEIVGVLDEEIHEVHEDLGKNQNLRKELLDVIVAAMHGIASIDSKQMDW